MALNFTLKRIKYILEVGRSIKSLLFFIVALGLTSSAYQYFSDSKYYIQTDQSTDNRTKIYYIYKIDSKNKTFNQTCANYSIQAAELFVYIVNDWPKLVAGIEFYLNIITVLVFYLFSLIKNSGKLKKEFEEINSDPVESMQTEEINNVSDSAENVLDYSLCCISVCECLSKSNKATSIKPLLSIKTIYDFIKGETFRNYAIKIIFIPGMYLINAIDYTKYCANNMLNYTIILFIMAASIAFVIIVITIFLTIFSFFKKDTKVQAVEFLADIISKDKPRLNILQSLCLITLLMVSCFYFVLCTGIYIYSFYAELKAKIIGSIFVFELASCIFIDIFPALLNLSCK